MKYEAKKVPEGINSQSTSPLVDGLTLVIATLALIVVSYLALGLISDSLAHRISLEREYKIFSQFRSKTTSASEIQSLTDQLWSHYPEAKYFQLATKTLDYQQPNAFMEGGGRLSVTKGLLKILKTDQEKAFVICHEIGHFYKRHVIEGMGRKLSLVFIFSILGIDNSSRMIHNSVENLERSFSRKQETEADTFALDCMNKHYGNVNGYDSFFNHILKEEKKLQLNPLTRKIMSFSSTHPLTEKRIQTLKKVIQENSYKN